MINALKSLGYGALDHGLTVLYSCVAKPIKSNPTIDPDLQRVIDKGKVSEATPEEGRRGVDVSKIASPQDVVRSIRNKPTE